MLAICWRTSDQDRDAQKAAARFSLLLVFVAGLMVLTPVSYRAGTDQAHAHSTFQLWIDAATGQSHHHDEVDHQQRVASAVYASADVVAKPVRRPNDDALYATHDDHDHGNTDITVILGDAPASQQPDTAEPVTSHLPLQHAHALGALGTLIALLLAGGVRRSRWLRSRRLTGVVHLLEPPPPRLAPC